MPIVDCRSGLRRELDIRSKLDAASALSRHGRYREFSRKTRKTGSAAARGLMADIVRSDRASIEAEIDIALAGAKGTIDTAEIARIAHKVAARLNVEPDVCIQIARQRLEPKLSEPKAPSTYPARIPRHLFPKVAVDRASITPGSRSKTHRELYATRIRSTSPARRTVTSHLATARRSTRVPSSHEELAQLIGLGSKPTHDGRADNETEDLAQRSETESLIAILAPQLGLVGAPAVHLAGRGKDVASHHQTKGVMVDGDVFLNPDSYDPFAASGRRLLAHEMTHVAQYRRPTVIDSGVGGQGFGAEAEADLVGARFARGLAISPPTASLANAPARDEGGADEAHVEKLLANPPAVPMSVQFQSLEFQPKPGSLWIAGVEKRLQVFAVLLRRTTGKSYQPTWPHEAIKHFSAVGGLVSGASTQGKAVQNEEMAPFRVQGRLALRIVTWLEVEKKATIALTAKQRKLLSLGVHALDAWNAREGSQHRLPAWYSFAIFNDRVMTVQNKPILEAWGLERAAVAALPGNQEVLAKAVKALDALISRLVPEANLLDAFRLDRELTNHVIYRWLFKLPTATKKEEPKLDPVPEQTLVDPRLASGIWLQAKADQASGAAAIRPGPVGSAARKRILDTLSGLISENKLEANFEADASLRNNEERVNASAYPSKLAAYPALAPPFFDRAAGASHKFTMSLTYPDNLSAVAHGFVNRYAWEVIHIPGDRMDQLSATMENPETKGVAPSWGTVLGQRMERQLDYAEADIKRAGSAIGGLEQILGPAGVGATSMVAVSRALAAVGSAISTFWAMATEPAYSATVPFKKPGLYVVRCRVGGGPPEPDAQVIRANSVAWIPVWVRKPETMGENRMELQLRQRGAAELRLLSISKQLAGDLSADERSGLLEEQKQIHTALHGSLDQVLNQESASLKKRQTSLKADLVKKPQERVTIEHELKAIGRRLEEIKLILETRTGRHQKHVTKGLEAPFRIPATFVGDTGNTMSLALEAMQKPSNGSKFVYHIADATTKDSSEADSRPKTNREDAIADGVKRLLERHTGYGRGYVTVHIPGAGGAIAPVNEGTDVKKLMRTIRIDADEAAIVMEGIEGLTTVISIAAIAAAPFTGGASLAILLPVGAIGAIPSAYRLADRGSTGTLRLDMATAMDVVNIVGSAAGLGQVGAGTRFVRVGGALMIVGLGTDGLGVILAGAQFIQAAANIDPNAPPGVRRAMLMELVGQQLMSLGMTLGASLARRGAQARARGGETALAGPALSRSNPKLHADFKKRAGRDVPIFEDPSLKGNSVEVRYDLDGYGLVTNVRVAMAKGADIAIVVGHARTVKTLGKFRGVQGVLRDLLDRVTTLFTGTKKPPRGSEAWNAKLELEKLPGIVEAYQANVRDGKMTAAAADAKIADLKSQIKRHEARLGDFAPGERRIAAKDNDAQAKAKGLPDPPADHRYVPTEKPPGFELLRDPTSDAIPRQLKKVGDSWTTEVTPIKKPPKPPATEADRAAVKELRGAHPDDTFGHAADGGGMLDINGQIKLHPLKIAALKAEGAWTKVLALTRRLKNGDPASPDELKFLKSQGISTKAQLSQAIDVIGQILTRLGLKASKRGAWKSAQARSLFGNMNAYERGRLKQGLNEGYLTADKSGATMDAAVRYALGKHPASVSEFIAHVQMWGQSYLRRISQLRDSYKAILKKRLASGGEGAKSNRGMIQRTVAEEVYGAGATVDSKLVRRAAALRDLNSEGGHADVDAEFQKKKAGFGGQLGSKAYGKELSEADLVSQIQKSGATFGSEANAVYHAHKHYKDLHPSEQTGNEVKDYLTSIRNTIATPDTTTSTIGANGTSAVFFKRTIPGPPKPKTLTAIVHIGPGGDGRLATYFNMEGR